MYETVWTVASTLPSLWPLHWTLKLSPQSLTSRPDYKLCHNKRRVNIQKSRVSVFWWSQRFHSLGAQGFILWTYWHDDWGKNHMAQNRSKALHCTGMTSHSVSCCVRGSWLTVAHLCFLIAPKVFLTLEGLKLERFSQVRVTAVVSSGWSEERWRMANL